MKYERIIDVVNSLNDGIELAQDYENNCIVGRVGEERFSCFSKEYNPDKGKIDSDITLRLGNAQMEVDNNYNGLVKKIVVENETSSETVTYGSNGISYANYNSPYKNEEVLFGFSCIRDNDTGANIIRDTLPIAQNIGSIVMEGNNQHSISLPEIFEKSFLDTVISNGFIGNTQVNMLEQQGYVYSKYAGMEESEIRDSSLEKPSSAISYTAVYAKKEDFEKKEKPLFIDVDILTSSKTEYNKFSRMIYVLDKNGKYQNVSGIALQTRKKSDSLIVDSDYSPLEYDYMMQYLGQINLSVESTLEFNTYYKLGNITSGIQDNLNQIRIQMEQLKYGRYIQQQIMEHEEKLRKDFHAENKQEKAM